MKNVTLFTAVFFTLALNAQINGDGEYYVERYSWKPSDKIEEPPEWIKEKDEAIFGWKYFVEYRYDPTDNNLYVYKLTHKQIWIGSDEAIEDNNKIYLPITNSVDVIELSARVIKPDGTVIKLNKEDINEGSDKDENTYQYFALEGLTKGSVVEYFFVTKNYPTTKGTKVSFQYNVPVYNLAIDIVSPSNLIFLTKSYNGLNDPVWDTVLEEQNRQYILQDTLNEIKTQPRAYLSPNRASVVYKLDENKYSHSKDISSFAYSSRNVYQSVNQERKKALDKKLKKVLEESGMLEAENQTASIIMLENYIKENYFIVTKSGESFSSVEAILKSKAMTEIGALRLYDGLFDVAGINYNIVLTCDKSKWRFDKKFENSRSLTHALLYFPDADIYIYPKGLFSRGSFIDYDLMDHDGLFLDAEVVGDEVMAYGVVQKIAGHTEKESVANQVIEWSFDPETQEGEIKVTRSTTGYSTYNYQTIVGLVPDKDLEEFKEDMLKNSFGDIELSNLEFENLESSKYPFEPLIIRASLPAEEFMEPSANSFVINFGEVIGLQSELYVVDSIRTLPVVLGNPRTYFHDITFNIPEGYQLKNLEALNMNISSADEDPLMSFTSTYTLEGNVLNVKIHEYYKSGELPKEMFEMYRKVVNAAADFNKIYLVLEPM